MTPISDERLQRMINDAIDEGESDNLVSALTELQSLRAQGGVRVEEDGDTERHIDDLRLRAFQTNADADKEAYLWACSKWFQDRHFRRMVRSSLEASPAPVSEECATDGCFTPATVHFERGGVGSKYCRSCYLKVQALTGGSNV